LDELQEFSEWYEAEYRKHCDDNNIPEEERKELGMIKMIADAKLKERE